MSELNYFGPVPGTLAPPEVLGLFSNISREEVLARTWFWATDKGEVVAAGGLVDAFQRSYYLGPSFVHPEYRGRGLQKELIRRRLETVPSGFPVFTEVGAANAACLINLLRSGFVPTGYDDEYSSVNLVTQK